MKTNLLIAALWLALVGPALAPACGLPPVDSPLHPMMQLLDIPWHLPALVATSRDATHAEQPLAELRRLGPGELDRLMRLHAQVKELLTRPGKSGKQYDPAEVQAALSSLEQVIDRVATQRGASASGLYWYTDLAAAQERARELNRPILSLRLLGRLTDEYSCANSRFFRAALYANAEVSAYLRDHFVLHWESVRAVPVVTIDFGDGRVLKRTLTGNSIHYVLAADGTPVDAVPGMYGPGAFLAALQSAEPVAIEAARQSDAQRPQMVADYHRRQLEELAQRWIGDRSRWIAPGAASTAATQQVSVPRTGAVPDELSSMPNLDAPRAALPPKAIDVVRTAVPKMKVEMRTLASVKELSDAASAVAKSPSAEAAATIGTAPAPEQFEDLSDDQWRLVAGLYARQCELDAASVEYMRREDPLAAEGTAGSEAAWQRMRENFQSLVALDTVRNEYVFHRRLHLWFAAGQATGDVRELNARVYAELFLTPDSDRWLGLVTPGVYTGLMHGGLSSAESAPPAARVAEVGGEE